MPWYYPPIAVPGRVENGTVLEDAGPVAAGTPGICGTLDAAAELIALAAVTSDVLGCGEKNDI
jgi:hypothetical protein